MALSPDWMTSVSLRMYFLEERRGETLVTEQTIDSNDYYGNTELNNLNLLCFLQKHITTCTTLKLLLLNKYSVLVHRKVLSE